MGGGLSFLIQAAGGAKACFFLFCFFSVFDRSSFGSSTIIWEVGFQVPALDR